MPSCIENLIADMRRELMSINPPLGVGDTAVPGMHTYHYESEAPLACSSGAIAVSFILSGTKSVVVGSRTYSYHGGEALLSGAALPSTFRAVGASPEAPFLAVSLALDRSMLLELAERIPDPEQVKNEPMSAEAVFTFAPTEDLLFDFERLMKLAKTPELVPLRAPCIIEDIHSLLLAGPTASKLLPLLRESAPASTILRAINWMRRNFKNPISIEALAKLHGMSTSNFHRQFKSVTGMSPLQFQKQIRLCEAQHLMLSERAQVSAAAYAVGYESPTQFVRDYKKLFGESPLRDVKRRRELGRLGGAPEAVPVPMAAGDANAAAAA